MLQQGSYRKSRQRERILELLRSTDTHPTANWVYDRLKIEFKNLSLGTVYRNLSVLAELGLVEKLSCGSTFDRFDANAAPHYHFVCEVCGSLIDLDMPVEKTLNKKAGEITGFEIRRHRTDFIGRCNRCRFLS